MTLSLNSGSALKWIASAFVLGNTEPHATWIKGIDALTPRLWRWRKKITLIYPHPS